MLTAFSTTTACTSQTEPLPINTQQQPASQPQLTGQWLEAGQLPLPLESHQMVVVGNHVYVLGGWNDTRGPYAEVYFTPLTPKRMLDNWQQATASMPLRLQHHAAIPYNNALYVLGGDNGFGAKSTVSDRIFRAIPNSQGDITAWVEVGKLPQPLTIHAVTTVGNQIYILGGSRTFSPETKMLDTIYTATISPEGEIGAFQPLASFPTPIGWMTATTIGSDIFAISGKVQFSPTQLTEKIWRAKVNADQQLAPFEGVGMTTPRERHATVKVDRTLVVIGGGGAKGVLSIVEAGELDPQGNLTAWTKLAPLPEARYAHAAMVHGSDIYVSGGFVRYGSNETSLELTH